MEQAIIKINGKQYIVKKGSLMKLDRVDESTLVDVMLYEDEKGVLIGEPAIEGYGVEFGVLENKKDKTISVRRYKSKSKYRKEKGHRQPISIVKVLNFGKDTKTSFKFDIEKNEPVKEEETPLVVEDDKVVKKVTKKRVVKKKE